MTDNKKFEETLCKDIQDIFQSIITDMGHTLDIPATARSGAQISDVLEDNFMRYLTLNPHIRVYNPQQAPKGNTKNPYDICWNYKYSDHLMNYNDLIWGDIKATNVIYEDSNPDLGTPEKMIKFMLDGHFHMLFIFFKYDSTPDGKIELLQYPNGTYAKCTLLKNINHTVRINPKPQFQVNINEEEEYRLNGEWVDMFEMKYYESLERIIENANRKKSRLKEYFDEIRKLHHLDTNYK